MNDIPPHVTSDLKGGVLWLTLNRPDQRNALSSGMIEALQSEIDRAHEETAVKVVVIAATGPAFCAGHDLKEITACRAEDDEGLASHKALLASCARLMTSITYCAKPVIAAIQGIATAAGCQLVATCDLAVSAQSSRFATPGVNLGLFCSTPLVAIGRKIGRKHAMELALTGDMFSADEAARMGLINRVVPDADLQGAVRELAQKIATKSQYSIKIGKQAFYRQLEMPLEEAYAYASEVMAANLGSNDAKEGTAAFFEKRPPKWSDQD